MDITDQIAARIAHAAVRELQAAQGQPQSPPFDQCWEWVQASAVRGAQAVRAGATDAERHDMWVAARQAEGWVYGPVQDHEKRTHPMLVPYDQLDEGQRARGRLFAAAVHALTD